MGIGFLAGAGLAGRQNNYVNVNGPFVVRREEAVLRCPAIDGVGGAGQRTAGRVSEMGWTGQGVKLDSRLLGQGRKSASRRAEMLHSRLTTIEPGWRHRTATRGAARRGAVRYGIAGVAVPTQFSPSSLPSSPTPFSPPPRPARRKAGGGGQRGGEDAAPWHEHDLRPATTNFTATARQGAHRGAKRCSTARRDVQPGSGRPR